jgi:hypothetical protein
VRLLDRVAQYRSPLILALGDESVRLVHVTGPADYSGAVRACPHRYVLGDDLTRTAAQLAFSDGDRLASCLDLIRVPATSLWVEWSDEVHQRVAYESGSTTTLPAAAAGRQAGLLLAASRCGRTGVARTFWSDDSEGDCGVQLSPLETHIDLRAPAGEGILLQRPTGDDFINVADPEDAGVNALLDCARFRFDDRWASYYRQAAATPSSHRAVLHESLAAVVRDVPLLLAFFLLLNARDATRSEPIDRAAVNGKRLGSGRSPLLDHVEVRASLHSLPRAAEGERVGGYRRPSRLHHVRGHLVRRGLNVFWRSPHVRGRATVGSVLTRTVCLAFDRAGTGISTRGAHAATPA